MNLSCVIKLRALKNACDCICRDFSDTLFIRLIPNSVRDSTIVMRNVSFENGCAMIDLRSVASVSLEQVRVYQCSCYFHIERFENAALTQCSFVELLPWDYPDMKPYASTGLVLVADGKCSITSCDFGNSAVDFVKISRVSLADAPDFVFEDCCFKQGQQKCIVAYEYSAMGFHKPGTVTFKPPMCFEQPKDSAIDFQGVKTVTGVEDNMFECTECHPPSPPTEEPPTEEPPTKEPPTEEPPTEEPPTEEATTGNGKSDSNNLPPGAAAGIAIAVIAVVVAVVAVVVVIIVLYLRKRKDQSEENDEELFDEAYVVDAETINTINSVDPERPVASNPLLSIEGEADGFSSIFEEAK